jgi:hypothetical protein
MKKLVASLLLACACAVTALAQPAQKAAAASSTTILFRQTPPLPSNVPDAGAWVTVLETSIKPPGGKDLFIGVSAVSEIVSVNDNAATGAITSGFAEGIILIRVLVDGVPATPGVVTLNFIDHAVSTSLSTQLSNCTEVDVGPNAGKVTCTSTPGVLAQVLLEASATSFNFIMQDVSPDVHDVKVQAQFVAASSTASNFAEAILASRTVTVESVKLDVQ